MTRLFASIDPPPDVVAHLSAVVQTLEVSRANAPGRSTRVATTDRWHVTLAFLGEVAPSRVDRAARSLASAAATAPPFGVRVAGGGTFGRGRFAVLWAGLAGDLDQLRALSGGVRAALRSAWIAFDPKPLRPHLTIARPGDRVTEAQLATDVATLDAYVGPLWTVDAVHLTESHLGPQPRYTRLASASLPP